MAQCLALSSRYFFEDSDFEGTFLGWAQAHCDPIDMESEEMKLEYVHLEAVSLAAVDLLIPC